MSSSFSVAQWLLLRLRNKRPKHTSFCGLEAFLGQAHVLQEDNAPQEQVIITATARQAITGGVSLSQGFWAFYGVDHRRQQQQQQLDDDEPDKWERPCLCFQEEDREGEEEEKEEETITLPAAHHHHHHQQQQQQQQQQQVDERKQAFERFFRSHWAAAQAALTQEMLDQVWLEVETGQSVAAAEVEQQEARRQQQEASMWQQQVRRHLQEDAGGSVSGKDWELEAGAYERQQQHEADEGQGREQVVWVNPWEISEARKVQLLAVRHV